MHKGPRRFTKKKASKITCKHHSNHKELEESLDKMPREVQATKIENYRHK